MQSLVFKIIHISDMHLYVDKDGFTRSRQEQAKRAISLQIIMQEKLAPALIRTKLIGDGLNAHDPYTLFAFEKTLNDIINNKDPDDKLIVIQTGDLETYGFSGDDQDPLPSFDYWDNQKAQYSSNAVFVDLYGNHDIWPGGVPILLPFDVQKALEFVRSRHGFIDAMPKLIKVQLNSCRLEIYRLNTVCCAWPLNTLSVGKVQTDYPIRAGLEPYYQASKSKNPIREIFELAKNEHSKNPGEPAVRMIILHHPPHYFQSNKWTEFTGARLIARRELGILLNKGKFKFHIIAGGHRHLVDPPQNICPLPASGYPQYPLPTNTVQLAAGSTTQEVSGNKDRPSFSLYIGKIDNQSNLLSIERTIYSHVDSMDYDFTPGHTHQIKQLDLF